MANAAGGITRDKGEKQVSEAPAWLSSTRITLPDGGHRGEEGLRKASRKDGYCAELVKRQYSNNFFSVF
jgi:hypothetical protein